MLQTRLFSELNKVHVSELISINLLSSRREPLGTRVQSVVPKIAVFIGTVNKRPVPRLSQKMLHIKREDG